MRRPDPFRLERYFDAREFATPWLLCASDCQSRSVASLLALEPGAEERLMALDLGYGTARGDESLRRAIAARHGDPVSADDVVVHTGGEEVILTFCLAELEAGDHVIVHTPCYQSLLELPASIGCRISRWRADLRRGGEIDLGHLESLLQQGAKAVFVNFPHNPTGYSPDAATWRKLVELVGRSGARLFSDEAYRGSARSEAAELESAAALDPRACSLSLVSKAFGLPGLRLGWCVSRDPELLERILAVKDYSTICAPRPSEHLAELALRHADALLGETRRLLERNRAAAKEFFDAHADRFEYHEPVAGPICFPRVKDGRAQELVDAVFESRGVILLPGSVFEDGEGHVRFGLGRANAPECFERLKEALRR
ncbi:MAG: pyridoxal phosphate-dependent aminotransferase [Planctomycetota bacterium]